jgi:hypothetical protein
VLTNAYQGNSWCLVRDDTRLVIGNVQAQRFFIPQWKYLGFIGNLEFTALSSVAFDVEREQSRREFAATSPNMEFVQNRVFEFMLASGQRQALSALLTFSTKRIVVASYFRSDAKATPDGRYLYLQQIGNPQVFRLPGTFLHPAHAVDGLEVFRTVADAIWTADLPIPEFPEFPTS